MMRPPSEDGGACQIYDNIMFGNPLLPIAFPSWVPFQKGYATRNGSLPANRAGQDGHFMTLLYESMREVGPNKTRSACYKNPH
jgi:hypothetical protein